jgi:hypothetical protein
MTVLLTFGDIPADKRRILPASQLVKSSPGQMDKVPVQCRDLVEQ